MAKQNLQHQPRRLERLHTCKQQKPELPTVTLIWHACKYKVHKLHQRYILKPTTAFSLATVAEAVH